MKLRKSIYLILLYSLACCPDSMSQDLTKRFFTDANRFFNKYVFEGRVDYQALSHKPESLSNLIRQIETLDIKNASPDTRKAFWINTYNLLVIKNVLDAWPVASVNQVPGFFEKPVIKINGEELSLNEIEDKNIRDLFKDGRYIFLINKGRTGDPPLMNQACTPDLLSTQLIDQITLVVNDTLFVKTDRDGFWQMADCFERHKEELALISGSMQAFVNKYRKMPVGPDYLLSFFSSDEQLNDDRRYSAVNLNRDYTDSTVAQKRVAVNGFYFEADDGRLADFKMEPWRQVVASLNNNFSSYKESYNKQLARNTLKYSFASNTTRLQLFYGAGRKTTVGLSLTAESARLAGTFTSPANIYELNNDTNSVCYIRSISPLVRFNISEGFFHIKMQNTFNFPVTKVEPLKFNGVKVSEENPYLLISQLYFFKYLSEYVRMGLETDLSFKISNKFETFTITPKIYLNTVFSMPLNHVFRIYGLIETSTGSNTSTPLKSYSLKEGTGISSRIGISELTLYYSYIFLGKYSNATNALVINLKVRI
jgi:hypothetical protein